jgi:hypothetical protein
VSMYEPQTPGTDIVGFVAHHLPRAIEWAEADILATRRARKHNLDRAVARARCPIGHVIPSLLAAAVKAGEVLGPGRPADPSCGYCQSAVQHARMWRPPNPAFLVEGPGLDVPTAVRRG